MKRSFAAVLAVLLCGCGGTEKKQFSSERDPRDFSSSDPSIGCYHYGTTFGVCIADNGNGTGSGDLVFNSGGGSCWKVGNLVWNGISQSGTSTYTATRYLTGGSCGSSSASATLTCSGTGCSSLTESWQSSNATWTRYSDFTGSACTGSYSTSGFTVSIPGGTLTAVPAGEGCWSSGEQAWSSLTWRGFGFYTGTRYNPGHDGVGCVWPQQYGPSSLHFTSDCSSFTEDGVWQATWYRQ